MKVAVGFFDGVHLGHRAILEGANVALTFADHPLSVLAPERAPRLVMSTEEKIAAIRAVGVPRVVSLDFTPSLAQLAPEDFATRHLAAFADASGLPCVRCGENWRFGAQAKGDAAFLRAHGYAVEVVPYVLCGAEPISSSRIRATLEAGRIEDASAMLGRPYARMGKVQRGKGLGSKIGYPTLNLSFPCDASYVQLPHGVYAIEANGLWGLANYGLAPTMGEQAWQTPVLEIHFPHDAPNQLASITEGEAVCCHFLHFLRPERKFASIDDLRRQIATDCNAAESFFQTAAPLDGTRRGA